MNEAVRLNPGVPAALELGVILLLSWLAFAAAPFLTGEYGLSWDTLNHHIYLGWTADAPRFDLDVLAASYQVYQFPYLYWPVYKLAIAGASGTQAGVVLAGLHVLAVPPVWMVARECLPGRGWFDAGMRALAVALAFMTGVVISLFGQPANDLLAAVPLLWALALALTLFPERGFTQRRVVTLVLASGALAGVSVAFKLSNGPLVVLLPLLWLMAPGSWPRRLTLVVAGGLAASIAFGLTYGYWGWQLWTHFGNPFFPFFDAWFDPLRATLGWKP